MIDTLNLDSIYAANTGRKMYLLVDMDDYDLRGVPARGTPYPAPLDGANLISSEIAPDQHMPVIDLDFPARVIPSSTPGHGHLYIDQELTWQQYLALLEGFHKAGLIQDAWFAAAKKDVRSYVRLPHVFKKEKVGEPVREGVVDDVSLVNLDGPF